MRIFHTIVIGMMISAILLPKPVFANQYDAALIIGLINPVLMPNPELGLDFNETVAGYFTHRAAFQNSTRLESFDDTGNNITLVVGNSSARISSYQLGLNDMGYEFQLDSYGFPSVESTFEFHMFGNGSETVIPVAVVRFPDEIVDQAGCIQTEQEICEAHYSLNIVNSNWNVTLIGAISIVSTAIFEDGKEEGSPWIFILWSVGILAVIVLLIKFLSK